MRGSQRPLSRASRAAAGIAPVAWLACLLTAYLRESAADGGCTAPNGSSERRGAVARSLGTATEQGAGLRAAPASEGEQEWPGSVSWPHAFALQPREWKGPTPRDLLAEVVRTSFPALQPPRYTTASAPAMMSCQR